MNKDVIYVDTEDDITAIIGRIKDSKEKIVALVPPKRIGILQSAVNLKLLARMAEHSNKRLVLVTNNKALINLSSVAKIPVSRNLQSKPEMAEIDALEIDDGEDIIDGKQLPVGELAKTADLIESAEVDDAIETIDVDKESPKIVPKSFEKSKVKVPDFSKFRKKLFIGIFLFFCLAGFLVWAIMFAPAAKVIITAQTTATPVSLSVKLGGTAATDISKGIIQTVSKQIQKSVSVTFTATGTQKLGVKATGTLTLSNADSSSAINVPTGSMFSSGIYDFTTVSSVNVPGAGVAGGSIIAGTASVNVTATDVGAEYNLAAGAYQSNVNGITAYGNQMSGGSSHMATIVTADDIQKASQALADLSSDSFKQQLISQFTNGEFVITDSFNVVHDAAVSTPAIGAEATGSVTLSSPTTFSITAIAKSEVEAYLKDNVNKQITGKSQRLYSDGIDNAKLSGYVSSDQGATVNINATGQIGPNIDEALIKQEVKGKQYGDVQSLLSGIDGANSVDIKFSYFWVNRVPTDVNKIDVQFILKND